MTNINYLVFIWNVFVDTLLLLIVYTWKMYDMQTLHGGGIPMFRGTYLVETCINLNMCLTGTFALWLVLPEFELHKGETYPALALVY